MTNRTETLRAKMPFFVEHMLDMIERIPPYPSNAYETALNLPNDGYRVELRVIDERIDPTRDDAWPTSTAPTT